MSDQPACGHSKIKRITWNENMGQSEKFMCIDCNTDFVPVTGPIRDFIFRQRFAVKQADIQPELTQHYDETMYK